MNISINKNRKGEKRNSRKIAAVGFLYGVIALLIFLRPSVVDATSDLEVANLIGPVHRVIQQEEVRNSTDTVKQTSLIMETITYDKNGNRLESQKSFYETDQITPVSIERSIFHYDPDGQKKEILSYSEDETYLGKAVHKFDGRGRQTEIISYSAEGSAMRRSVTYYDDNGKKSETVYYKLDDFVSMRMNHFNKQSNSNETTSDVYADDLIDFRRIRIGDTDNRKTEERIIGGDGTLERRLLHFYNESGEKVKMSVYDGKGTIRLVDHYSYYYDSVGNWIRKKVSRWQFGKGSHEYSIVRMIEYLPIQPRPMDEKSFQEAKLEN